MRGSDPLPAQSHLPLVARPLLALALASAVAVALLLFLTRNQTFFADDWTIITARQDWTLDAFMAPHNDHWVLLTALLWKPLLEIVGLRSYLPYLGLVLAAHVVLCAGLYRAVSREAGVAIGLVAAVRILFFAHANEVFFQASVFNLVASAAAGVWALWLFLERRSQRRLVVAAVLLCIGVASSGAGLFFVVGIGAAALLTPGRRRDVWVVLPALAAYTVWLLTYGSGTTANLQSADIPQLIGYVWTGITGAIGATLGLVQLGTLGVVVIVAAIGVDLLRRRRLPPGVVAGLAGFVAAFVIIGLARDASFGADQALAPRYAYVTAPLLLIGAAAWLGPRLRGFAHRREVVAALCVAGLAVTAAGTLSFIPATQLWTARADAVRAVVSIFLADGGLPAVPLDLPAPGTADDPWISEIPTPGELQALVARFGSPLGNADPSIPADVYDPILFAIVRPAILVTNLAAMPADPVTGAISATDDLVATPESGCLALLPAGPGATVTLRADGSTGLLALLSDRGGDAGVSFSARGTWADDTIMVPLAAGQSVGIGVPDLGTAAAWLVRIQPPAGGTTLVCLGPRAAGP